MKNGTVVRLLVVRWQEEVQVIRRRGVERHHTQGSQDDCGGSRSDQSWNLSRLRQETVQGARRRRAQEERLPSRTRMNTIRLVKCVFCQRLCLKSDWSKWYTREKLKELLKREVPSASAIVVDWKRCPSCFNKGGI